MTPQEIIAQVENCKNITVFNNPIIKIFLRLNIEDKEVVAKLFSDKNMYIFEDERINIKEFLPCLWSVLSVDKKKELSSRASHFIQEEGIEILELFPFSDIDLIFENFDIKKLTWKWKEIQQLLSRFSKDEFKKHIKCYFKPYVSEKSKLKALLDSLTEEERCWIFMNMDDRQFMACFADIDFLFNYFSSKNRVAILKRVSSDVIFGQIKRELFLFKGFKIFLERFDIEDRKEVILLMNPQHLQQIITLIIKIEKTFKRLPEADRYDFIRLLCVEPVKKIVIKNENHLFHIAEKLLPKHRFEFLIDFGEDFLRKTCHNWEIFIRIFNVLPPTDDELFLNVVGSHIKSKFPGIFTFSKIAPEKRFLFIARMDVDKLQNYFTKHNIHSVLEELPDEDRLFCLLLANQILPGGLKNFFFSSGGDVDLQSYHFKSTALLLPEKDLLYFFDLFSITDLHNVYKPYAIFFKEIEGKIKNYLMENSARRAISNSSISPNSIPKNSSEKNTNVLQNSFLTFEPKVKKLEDNCLIEKDKPASSDNIGFSRPITKNDDIIWKKKPALPSTFKKIVGQDFINFSETKKLDALIEELASPKYGNLVYKNLENALIDFRKAVSVPLMKEFKDPYFVKDQKIRQVINSTVVFLERFLSKSNPDEKLKMIEAYEKEMRPYQRLHTIGNCLVGIVIATLCIFSFMAFGLGIGFFVGSWSGPGAIVTGLGGLFAGLALATSVCRAGVTFFKSPVKNAVGDIIHNSKKIVKEEDSNQDHLIKKSTLHA